MGTTTVIAALFVMTLSAVLVPSVFNTRRVEKRVERGKLQRSVHIDAVCDTR